ncbi:MAG: hypothetical protein K2K08_01620 [Paramuribaculum sp.]|nr:hypothetical protein [Paramuribaculum sp.]
MSVVWTFTVFTVVSALPSVRGLLGLLLLILRTVILIVLGGKFSRNLAVEGGKFGLEHNNSGQCRYSLTALSVGIFFSLVMGLHIFLESVSV